MFRERLFKFRMIAAQCGANFAILPDEALSELATAPNEHSFHTKTLFPKNRDC